MTLFYHNFEFSIKRKPKYVERATKEESGSLKISRLSLPLTYQAEKTENPLETRVCSLFWTTNLC